MRTATARTTRMPRARSAAWHRRRRREPGDVVEHGRPGPRDLQHEAGLAASHARPAAARVCSASVVVKENADRARARPIGRQSSRGGARGAACTERVGSASPPPAARQRRRQPAQPGHRSASAGMSKPQVLHSSMTCPKSVRPPPSWIARRFGRYHQPTPECSRERGWWSTSRSGGAACAQAGLRPRATTAWRFARSPPGRARRPAIARHLGLERPGARPRRRAALVVGLQHAADRRPVDRRDVVPELAAEGEQLLVGHDVVDEAPRQRGRRRRGSCRWWTAPSPANPTASGSSTVRPQPGMIPTRAWVSANRARSDATRKSQASASSNPPVIATPLMAPMTGRLHVRERALAGDRRPAAAVAEGRRRTPPAPSGRRRRRTPGRRR